LLFEEIYHSFSKQVYNLALHYLQHQQDAQDVTQEVFVAIFSSYDKFENRSSLQTWIYRITVNKCLDTIRSKKRRARLGGWISFFNPNEQEAIQPAEFNHPGVQVEQKEQLRKMFDCINSLSEQHKTVLILSKIMKWSQVEVAAVMETTPKAVESMLQRAKMALDKKLKEMEGK